MAEIADLTRDEREVLCDDNFLHIGNRRAYYETDTLVVAVDGACRGNGRNEARAGYGVYFGPRNPYNECGPLRSRDTSQRAELVAAIRGLNRAMKVIRKELDGGKQEWRGTVYLKTDSQYMSKGITEWIHKWKESGWLNAAGNDVANKELWCQLLHRIRSLREHYDVTVLVWWVPRENNRQADELANRGADMA